MKKIAGELCGFLVVGGVNTVVTYALFLVLVRYTHYWTAYTIAFVVGIALSYVLNALFVFTGRHSTGAMFKFSFVYVFQYLYGSLALVAIVEGLGIGKPVAMLIVIATSVLVTFVLVRLAFHGLPAGAQFLPPQGPS
jgi:putative flippase GtrA